MNGVYIHIPFCKSKCPYCDFHSQVCDDKLKAQYIQALVDEIKTLRRTKAFLPDGFTDVDTLYIGGGTPSVLKAEELESIVETAKSSFNISDNAEITIECNPGSHIEELIPTFKKCGVNRVSLGMQSAVDSERRILGRTADKQRVKNVIDLLKSNGIENISLDIMLGIPNQTKESLSSTLEFIKECNVPHVSAYILKIEEGTFFHTHSKRFEFPDDDQCCELYEYCYDYLADIGIKPYEISNFARNGYKSKHNLKYWTLENYLGIGAAAHSFVDGKRFFFKRDTLAFINGESAEFDCDGGDEKEYIMLRLRLREGLKLLELSSLYSPKACEKILKMAPLFQKHGLVDFDGETLSLTQKGALLSNSIIAELI